MSRSHLGFTLIELLAVVTIIVVLLALLVPAMDKAIYQAELAVCSAQLKGIATGGTVYASGSKRYYPSPPQGRQPSHQPDELGRDDQPQHDMRIPLTDHLALKSFLCPLAAGEITFGSDTNQPDTSVFSTYQLWFGAAYTDVNGRGGMKKIGDRLGWSDPQFDVGRFNVLANDLFIYLLQNVNTQSTHQDRLGVSAPLVYQDKSAGEAFVQGLGGLPVLRLTVARWGDVSGTRDDLEHNFVFDDGGVRRFNEIGLPDNTGLLPGFKRLPAHAKDDRPEYRVYLPPVGR